MNDYATGTKVDAERSRSELDSLLEKHGATSRGIAVDDERGMAVVGFRLGGLSYRLEVPMPVPEKPKAGAEPRGWNTVWCQAERDAWVDKQWRQKCRERWRAILLLTRAKLEAVKLEISTVEREFMPSLVLDDGRTVYEAIGQRIHVALSTRQPLMLGA